MNLPRNPCALTRSAHTPRSEAGRVMSMSYANEGEMARQAQILVWPRPCRRAGRGVFFHAMPLIDDKPVCPAQYAKAVRRGRPVGSTGFAPL